MSDQRDEDLNAGLQLPDVCVCVCISAHILWVLRDLKDKDNNAATMCQSVSKYYPNSLVCQFLFHFWAPLLITSTAKAAAHELRPIF